MGETRIPISQISSGYNDVGYSSRRYFIDEFFIRHVEKLPQNSLVLDLGGNKSAKRGYFNIETYDLQVIYANLSTQKKPDVQTHGAHLPFADNIFDVVICAELLEHVPDPQVVLKEVYRVMRDKGSILLITVPFFIRLHADPFDYGRYTDYYWLEYLSLRGFKQIHIEKQGLFWIVFVDLIREFVYEQFKKGRPPSSWLRWQITKLVNIGVRMTLKWEARSKHYDHPFYSSFTTGFGVRAEKRI